MKTLEKLINECEYKLNSGKSNYQNTVECDWLLRNLKDIKKELNQPSCLGAVSGWMSSERNKPEKNKYVLGYTPFCKYKCAVVFWSGLEWRSAENKDIVWNVDFWQELPNIPCN